MAIAQAVTPQAEARLLLRTLGAASLGVYGADGQAVQLFGPGKPLGLVAYLASSPGHAASRDHLVDLLWAHLEPEAAHHALRQTLWFLHQRLGERAVVARDPELTLHAALE